MLQPSAKQVNAAVSELDLSVQNSVIVNNAIIKVTCIWMILKLRMKIMIMTMPSILTVIPSISNMCILYLVYWSKELQVLFVEILTPSLPSHFYELI